MPKSVPIAPDGLFCIERACATCESCGAQDCGVDVCVYPAFDPLHCGVCNNECGAGQVCSQGGCVD